IWLPLTSRTASRLGWPRRWFSTSLTHGPAALTIARARTSTPPESAACHSAPSRRAKRHSVPTRMRAPRSAASTAFATTRRASSTQQDLALGERLGDQAELELLEIAQPAMDQLRGRRRGRRRQIAAFDQQHREPAAGSIAGDAGAIDAAADDQQVIVHFHASGMRTVTATPSPAGRFAASVLPPWYSAIRRAT